MPDGRTRWVLGILAVLMVLGTGMNWFIQAHRPAPVVISGAAPLPLSPLPATSTPAVAALAPAAPDSAPSTPNAPSVVPPTSAPAQPEMLYVHVAGAVRYPSVYRLAPGSRVIHAIKAAGGATQKADLDALNLAEKIQDGEKIYVPTHAATAAQNTSPVATVSPDASLPLSHSSSVTKSATGAASYPAKMTSPGQGLVDINTAGADGLERLPGIGPAMAARIIAYRQQAGRFATTDELMQVGGIGPKKYARIAPLIKL